MRTEGLTFRCDGLDMAGVWYLPEPAAARADRPALVVTSGFCGMLDRLPKIFAEVACPLGYPVFSFDYRGFGLSGGTPGDTLLDDQARDMASALVIAHDRASAEKRPLVLATWAMSSPVAVQALKLSRQVAAFMPMNGFYNGRRWLRSVKGEADFARWLDWLDEERARLARGGEAKGIHPFEIYPLDPVTAKDVYEKMYEPPGWGPDQALCFADSLLSVDGEGDLSHLAAVPALIVHGAENALHPPQESLSFHARYPGPRQLLMLDGVGHLGWIGDSPAMTTLLDTME
ncbi:MAG: alpha/beta hydrolase, partial [Alphaproteobacteria bacterium]